MNSPIFQAAVDKHRAEDRAQQADDIMAVMKTPAGRRLFMHIILAGGVYTHTRRDDNPFYISGHRDAALELMASVNDAAPELAITARKERHDLIAGRNRQLQEIETREKQKEEENARTR